MYNENQNNPQEFRQTGRGSHGAHGMRGGMNATDGMPQDGQNLQDLGMAQCRRHGGNGGRGRNGQGMGMGMRQNGQGQCQRRSGNAMTQRSTPPDSAPAIPTGDGTAD